VVHTVDRDDDRVDALLVGGAGSITPDASGELRANRFTRSRIAALLTMTPRSASRSSTSAVLSAKRWQAQTAQAITSRGKRQALQARQDRTLVHATPLPQASRQINLAAPRSGFIHVDLGPARQWGERFPVRETAFAAETPPAREVLADSRTMKGSGAAGLATLGAAGVEVAQSVLAETQSAILPLAPYLDTLRWVFIAVALGGIAVTIYARLDDWRRGQR